MPIVRYSMWHLASPISYIGLYTKQTQTIHHKAQDLRTLDFLTRIPLDVTAKRASTVNFGYKRFRYKGFSLIRDYAKGP